MSIDQARREFEASRKADASARALLDSADEAKRDVTAEEAEQIDKWLDEADSRAKRARRLDDTATRASELDALLAGKLPVEREDTASVRKGDAALIANMRHVVDAHRLGEDAGERTLEFRMPDAAEIRALADFSDGTKVYVNDFRSTLAVYMRTMSPWIETATIINGTDGRPIVLPVLSADPTGYSPGEGTAITESTPTMGSALATPVSYKALSYLSQELEQDEQIGLLPFVARSQGRALALQAGSAFTSAIVTAATNGGTATGVGGGGGTAGTAVVTFLGYEDFITLKYGIAAPYRKVGAWFMANSVIQKAKKFKDGQGQYLWQPAIALGLPDMFDGNPVYEDPYLAAAASASKSVLFGDPSAVLVKQLPLRVATSDQFKFDADQIAIKTVYRAAAGLPDAAAIRYLVSANT